MATARRETTLAAGRSMDWLASMQARKATIASLKQRHEYLGFRSKRSYRLRMMLAWLFNLSVFVVCCMVSIIYGRLFGKARTNDMVIGWVLASGQTWGAIEPVQVLMVATLPFLIKEGGCCDRQFQRVRYVYNEFFAP